MLQFFCDEYQLELWEKASMTVNNDDLRQKFFSVLKSILKKLSQIQIAQLDLSFIEWLNGEAFQFSCDDKECQHARQNRGYK